MNRFWKVIWILSLLVFLSLNISAGWASQTYDLIIRNGKIIDGTGNPWFYADIGIKGDTIAAIGNLSGVTADKEIEAKGMVVCPGFIDMHTHCDDELGNPQCRANLNYLIQGVTTVVTGNCGESVSLEVLKTKEKWEKQGIGTHAVFLVGHGNIRGEEKLLTLEDAVRKMTSLPASFLQMKKRGLLKEGFKADVVVFDPHTVRDNATYADSRRYSSGVYYVLLDGKISIDRGKYHGALNGRVLLLTENH